MNIDTKDVPLAKAREIVLAQAPRTRDARTPIFSAEKDRAGSQPTHKFAPRQLDCMRELCNGGKSNGEIAAALHISEGTVRDHIIDCCRRAGVRNRVELALYCVRNHITP